MLRVYEIRSNSHENVNQLLQDGKHFHSENSIQFLFTYVLAKQPEGQLQS
jgi:hypothetical protein